MEGLGVYKYLQIFLVLVDVMELEHVGMFDELQDGNLPLHLRGHGHERRGQHDLPTSPSAPKGTPATDTFFLCTRTFISTDSDNFSLFTILTATFWPVMQWTPSFTSPGGQILNKYGVFSWISSQVLSCQSLLKAPSFRLTVHPRPTPLPVASLPQLPR